MSRCGKVIVVSCFEDLKHESQAKFDDYALLSHEASVVAKLLAFGFNCFKFFPHFLLALPYAFLLFANLFHLGF
ncbi:hypothetical protein SLA2020_357470 [Shorea laevis]